MKIEWLMANLSAGGPPHQKRKRFFGLRITFWSSWTTFMAGDAICYLNPEYLEP